jgi:uncharacterized protein DUF397
MIEWRTSSFSGEDANCVEVAHTEEAAAIRDSKDSDGPYLVFPAGAFRVLIASAS